MKNLALLFCLLASISFGQTTMTSTQDGDFWGPSTWDCFCFPADGDTVIIQHNITLSTGIAYTMGQIRIEAGGTLDDGANTFSFYINGGSMINNGTLTIDNLLLDAGWIQNNGTANLDSVWTRSTTENSGVINTNAFAHDENATFDNIGVLTVADNFANQGVFNNTGLMTIVGNASNCNVQTTDATFDNDGTLCIGGNFLNCDTDTIRGSGVIYIGGTSSNSGVVEGNGVIHTPSGGFDFDNGTTAGSVTFGTNACGIGLEEEEEYEEEEIDWLIYPNPATSIIRSSEQNVKYTIYDMTGRKMLSGVTFNGVIHIDALSEGNYTIQLENKLQQSTTKTFIKL